MDDDIKALKSEIFKLSWFMRGGMTLEEAFQLSYDDRSIINEMVKDNLDTTKETGLPFF